MTIRWRKGMYGCAVPMREDRATTEDVERVAKWFAGLDKAKEPDDTEREYAYAVLAVVFNGEHSQ